MTTGVLHRKLRQHKPVQGEYAFGNTPGQKGVVRDFG